MRLARATRIPPFDDDARSLARHAVGLGLIVAGCAALVPATAALWLFVAVALAPASLVAGSIARSLQAVAVALGAGLIAALLCFPWTLEFVLPGSDVTSFLGVERFAARGPSLGALLRFQTGPLGAPPLGWAFIVAAALPLLIGREWRLTWAIRCWVVALACFGVAWAAGRGWIGTGLPAPDVLLAPAAIALALVGRHRVGGVRDRPAWLPLRVAPSGMGWRRRGRRGRHAARARRGRRRTVEPARRRPRPFVGVDARRARTR